MNRRGFFRSLFGLAAVAKTGLPEAEMVVTHFPPQIGPGIPIPNVGAEEVLRDCLFAYKEPLVLHDYVGYEDLTDPAVFQRIAASRVAWLRRWEGGSGPVIRAKTEDGIILWELQE